MTLADDLGFDHIQSLHHGGVDHAWNLCIMLRSTNSSVQQWLPRDKKKHLGDKAYDTWSKFMRWHKKEAKKKGVNCNDFKP